MKKYIVFNQKTGEILRTGTCPENMLNIQTGKGEGVIEGSADDRTEKIIDKQVIKKTPSEIAEPPQVEPQEILIRQKEREILRRLAVEELKTEGKL